MTIIPWFTRKLSWIQNTPIRSGHRDAEEKWDWISIFMSPGYNRYFSPHFLDQQFDWSHTSTIRTIINGPKWNAVITKNDFYGLKKKRIWYQFALVWYVYFYVRICYQNLSASKFAKFWTLYTTFRKFSFQLLVFLLVEKKFEPPKIHQHVLCGIRLKRLSHRWLFDWTNLYIFKHFKFPYSDSRPSND